MPEPLTERPRLGRSGRIARRIWLVAAAACLVSAVLSHGAPRGRLIMAVFLFLGLALVATVLPFLGAVAREAERAGANGPRAPHPLEVGGPGSARSCQHDLDVIGSVPHTLRSMGADPAIVARADALQSQAEGPGRLLSEGRGPLTEERRQVAALARQMEALVARAGAAAQPRTNRRDGSGPVA